MDITSLLVGAGLAIAGGLIGQLVAFKLKSAETKHAYRRDKLDQLMLSLGEDEHWIDAYRVSLLYRDGEAPRAEPFDRVQATVMLYFREELKGALEALRNARHNYRQSIGTAYSDRLSRAIAAGLTNVTTTAPTQAHALAVTDAYSGYRQAFVAFRQACAVVAGEFV